MAEQSRQTRGGLPAATWSEGELAFELERCQEQLLTVERSFALLHNFSPKNFREQCHLVAHALRRGKGPVMRFDYPPLGPQIAERFSHLERLSRHLQKLDRTSVAVELLGERIVELSREADLLRSRCRVGVAEAAAQRYPLLEAELQAADELSERWLNLLEPADSSVDRSASAHGAVSSESAGTCFPLAQALVRRARRDGVDVPIVEMDMVALAAASEDAIYVRAGVSVDGQVADRVWAHEAFAHYMPRRLGRRLPAPCAVGSALSDQDEEGRALVLEERVRALSPARKVELAVRHQLALASRQSETAGFDKARELLQRGVAVEEVATSLCRALRGGGLAREVIYLPAYLRVSQALAAWPDLDRWMGQARLSARAARKLARAASCLS